jgi:outer membrane biosynthesis protein TonB
VSEDQPTAEAEPVEATAPSEEADPVPPVETTEAVVEQNTGDVLATEAVEDQTESLGMTSSPRPQRRPERPAETEVAEAPAEEPAEQPAEEATTDTAAIDEALAAALAAETTDSGTEDGGNTAPQGPPMTAGEKDGLRVAVNRCWNVGALSTEALRVTVTVYVSLGQDGKPVASSVEMATFEGGSEAAARQAFEAAKRAIIRCGADGYDLPAEKYEEWKELSIVFDPNGMRMR